jgi:hypothetical protein
LSLLLTAKIIKLDREDFPYKFPFYCRSYKGTGPLSL